MAYDPTKPVDDSPLDAAEMRGQLTALKALIDGLQAQIVALQTLVNQKASLDDVNQAVAANSARNVDGFVFRVMTFPIRRKRWRWRTFSPS
jgi:hypothetical protein